MNSDFSSRPMAIRNVILDVGLLEVSYSTFTDLRKADRNAHCWTNELLITRSFFFVVVVGVNRNYDSKIIFLLSVDLVLPW